jgi:hypothetical protein
VILVPADALLQYRWVQDKVARYEIQVEFDGYLPIFGGRNAKALVLLGLEVAGRGDNKAGYRVTAFSMKLDETPLSFNEKNIQGFFPPADVTFKPSGEVSETSAPKTKLPFRLPGLDPQRLPDISFAPIVFPERLVGAGEMWTYRKVLNGATTQYDAKLRTLNADNAEVDVEIRQSTTFGEDASGAVVELSKATRTLESETKGEASATFDPRAGQLTGASIRATTVDSPSDGTSARTLKTTILVKRLT